MNIGRAKHRKKLAKSMSTFARNTFILAKCSSPFIVVALMLCLAPMKSNAGAAPSLSGVPGLVRIPTADFMQDGVIYAGANLIPKQALPYSQFINDGLVTFFSVTFLPFIEFDLRLTKQLGRPASKGHTVDRSPSIRLKLLRDRGVKPAIVLGFHDIFSTVEAGEARHFGSTYVVATKIFKINNVLLSPTLGYGLDVIEAARHDFIGLFGGLKFQIYPYRQFAVCVDYDSESINLGADAELLDSVIFKCALVDLRYFSVGASMHFDLFDVF